MYGYYCRQLKGILHVIHEGTGLSLPYADKKWKMEEAYIDYKRPYFDAWMEIGGAARKRVKLEAWTKILNKEALTLDHEERLRLDWISYQTDMVASTTILAKERLLANSVPTNNLYAVQAPPYEEVDARLRGLEEEEDMFIDTCNDQDTNARSYLEHRLNGITYNKEQGFQRTFGLVDDKRPSTPKDLIDRITSGKYVVASDKMEVEEYEPLRRFRWRDPSVKEDKAGYDTTLSAMRTAQIEVNDAIMIKTPTEALTALKEFESKTFH